MTPDEHIETGLLYLGCAEKGQAPSRTQPHIDLYLSDEERVRFATIATAHFAAAQTLMQRSVTRIKEER